MRDWTVVERYLRRLVERDGMTEDHLVALRQRLGTESVGTGPNSGTIKRKAGTSQNA